MRSSTVPHLGGVDHTLSFLRQGYPFIMRNCDRLGTDIFRARLMLRPAICLRGASAARLFYEGDRLTRVGAMPPTTLRLLQDKGSVQQLDGEAHRRRKALFVRLLMTDAAEMTLLELFREEWHRAVVRWSKADPVALLDGVSVILTHTICRWAGLPMDEPERYRLAVSLRSMIDNAGNPGPTVLAALLRRSATERLLRHALRDVRNGRLKPKASTPLSVIATHRETDGELLPLDAAAVELLNILRPAVAVARYIVFAALALHQHPQWRERLRDADDATADAFAEEVRRFYPFFPLVGARVRSPFEWDGLAFETGDWLLLDLYGTSHDLRHFSEPADFRPDRRLDWREGGFAFIPQGGGRAETGHRCPGERFTVAMTREAVRMLVNAMSYEVPPQDLTIPLDRFPTGPRSGFIIANCRLQN